MSWSKKFGSIKISLKSKRLFDVVGKEAIPLSGDEIELCGLPNCGVKKPLLLAAETSEPSTKSTWCEVRNNWISSQPRFFTKRHSCSQALN